MNAIFKGTLRSFAAIGFIATAIALQFTASAHAQTLNGVGFGDSLMAGYQLPNSTGFPEQLQASLQAQGYDVEITNAGVSGDTSSGGLARLDWSVADGTSFVILELGANDALRGISPQITRQNLDAMISGLKQRGIKVFLVGILAPPNMGQDYSDAFNPIYAELAATHDVPLYPFFLDGVITVDGLMLADGIHPNEEGVAEMVRRFLPFIKPGLDELVAAQ